MSLAFPRIIVNPVAAVQGNSQLKIQKGGSSFNFFNLRFTNQIPEGLDLYRTLGFVASRFCFFGQHFAHRKPALIPVNMDVVLEVFDLLVGDRLYAAALPATLSTKLSPALSTFIEDANNTLALFGDAQSFKYQPATSYLYIEPSKYAYMSAWPRDNIYRQAFSLFLITW